MRRLSPTGKKLVRQVARAERENARKVLDVAITFLANDGETAIKVASWVREALRTDKSTFPPKLHQRARWQSPWYHVPKGRRPTNQKPRTYAEYVSIPSGAGWVVWDDARKETGEHGEDFAARPTLDFSPSLGRPVLIFPEEYVEKG